MGMLIESIDKIIQYNTAPQKQKVSIEESFTPEQKQLKASLEKLMMSYFADDIRVKAKAANEISETVLAEAVKTDIEKLIGAFVEFIAYNNVNLPDDKKLSSADIFKIIATKN